MMRLSILLLLCCFVIAVPFQADKVEQLQELRHRWKRDRPKDMERRHRRERMKRGDRRRGMF